MVMYSWAAEKKGTYSDAYIYGVMRIDTLALAE